MEFVFKVKCIIILKNSNNLLDLYKLLIIYTV